MSHHITIVEDDQLPEDHDFVFVASRSGAHIFYRRSSLDEEVLEDSWAAYRAVTARNGPVSPTRADGVPGEVVRFARRVS